MRSYLCRMIATFAISVVTTLSLATFSPADSLRNDTALQWIPDTASFYTSALRNREQIDRLLNSRAYQRLLSMPVLQMGIAQFKSQIEDDAEGLSTFMQDPDNQALVELLKDAASLEVFVYGGRSFKDVFGMLVRFGEISNEIQLESLASGGEVDEDAVANKMLDRIATDLKDMDVPRLVIGFRLSDPSSATAQLARLEELIQKGIEEEPKLANAYKKQQIDGSDWLTISVDSSMIPWDELDDDEDKAEQLKQIKTALDGKQAVVALGLRENYLLLQTGKSIEALRGFGEAGKKLIDHEKMAIVRKYDDQPVTGVAYIDGEFLRAIYQPERQLDSYVKMAKAGLENAPIDDDLKKALAADAEGFATDIKQYYPEMGAVAAVQYLTDDGYEGFTQNWSENLMIDGSKPLDILSNVGGAPLAMFAFRGKYTDGRGYQMMSKWMSRFAEYGQKAAQQQLEGEQKEVYEKAVARTMPLMKKFDQVTRENLIPAFGDGQMAFVLDGKIESRQWHLMMPPAAEPLPMFEFAKVRGVTDAEKLKTAFSQYAEVADEMLKYAQELAQENEESLAENLDGPAQMLPALLESAEIPRPTPREIDGGTLYEFGGLAQMGLDGRLAPAAGISKDRFVFSLSPKTAERLLKTTQLVADGPLVDSATKKLGAATRIDLAGIIGVIRAWTNYGMSTAAELQDNDEIAAMIPTVDGIMEIMQCYRSIENVTYSAGDSMISHSRARFQDLPE